MGTAIKHPVSDQVKPSFVIFDIRAQRQSDRMSKITNEGFTRSGTGCFIDMPTLSIKGIIYKDIAALFHYITTVDDMDTDMEKT